MKVHDTEVPGVQIVEPDICKDDRGYFLETWNQHDYRELGVEADFVQDNLSWSEAGVLRGLHFQNPHSQAKLVSVLEGEVFDVAIDLRRDAPTFGQWSGLYLSGDDHRQLFVPEYCAHGFVVTGERALFHYKCSDFYAPDDEHAIRWDDPEIGIDWPVDSPSLSDKDAAAPRLEELDADTLF
jgi:dTDP-4-dehydrorhamnose 3,5-epimerase